MTDCRFCGEQGLEWSEALHCLVNPITAKKHGFIYCVAKEIPLFKVDNGVPYPRKDESLAYDIVNEAMRLGYRGQQFQHIKTERKGNSIIVKK